jgi:hypothetical protein
LAGLLCGTICLVGVINSWPLASTEGGMTGGAKAALSLAIGTLLIPFGWYLICGLRMLISRQVNRLRLEAGGRSPASSYRHAVPAFCGCSSMSRSRICLGSCRRGLVFALWLVAFIGATTQRQRLGRPTMAPWTASA